MPTGDTANIAPQLWAAIVATERDLGFTIQINSGYRSPAEQRSLYANRGSNPYPVATPGRSKHERSPAEAVDISSFQAARVAVAGAKHGLCRPVPRDPVHFELCGAGDSGGGGGGDGLGIGDVLGALNPLAPIQALADVVLDPRAWAVRLLEVVGGLVLIGVGAYVVAKDLG